MYLQKSDVENIMVIGDSGLAYHSLIIDLTWSGEDKRKRMV